MRIVHALVSSRLAAEGKGRASLRPGPPGESGSPRGELELLESRIFLSAEWDAVLIDASLPDREPLSAAAEGAYVIEYDGCRQSARDVLETVTRAARSAGATIRSLSILSHGSSGGFALGNERVSIGNLPAQSEAWAQLGEWLTVGSNIYIFGCNVAEPLGDGQALLDELSRVTGADVFASINLTGRVGDWRLEAGPQKAWQELATGLALPLDLERLASYAGSLVNTPPVANDDSYSLEEDEAFVAAAVTVLDNDTDVDGDGLTAVLVADVTDGTLTLNANGTFSYTPEANYTGSDSFTYQAHDGSEPSLPATVSLTVNPLNDAPVANADAYGTDEDALLSLNAASGVLANDTDVESEPLSAVLVSDVAHGSLTLNADGSFAYSPDPDYTGSDSFSYRADDGADLSGVATVTITVNPLNDAPVANDDAFTIDEDGTITTVAPGILGNDLDVDGDALSATLISDVSHGSLTFNADGSFSYTPEANYYGPDGFTYRAGDGTAASAPATVTFTINPLNDAPDAGNDAYRVTTDEDDTFTVPAPGLLVNDSDVEGSPLTAVLVEDVSHGSLALNADGSFSYTPTPNYNGNDQFKYQAFDGELYSPTALVAIFVNSVNDPPVAEDDGYSVEEDVALAVSAGSGVLANDRDVDSLNLRAVLVSDVSHGCLTLYSDGGFVYTPEANYCGLDGFTYKADDGADESNVATVMVTVGAVNDVPTAHAQTVAIGSAASIEIVLSADDVETPLESMVFSIVTQPLRGSVTLVGKVATYTPDPGWYGEDEFEFTVQDADGGVSPPAAAAVSTPFAMAANSKAGFTDAGGTAVKLSLRGPGSMLVYFADEDGGDISRVVLSGTTQRSSLKVANGVRTTIGSIIVGDDDAGNGIDAIGRIDAGNVDLLGDLRVEGSLGRLTLANLCGPAPQTIRIGPGNPNGAKLALGQVKQLSLASQSPIRSLRVAEWLAGDLTAGSIGQLFAASQFGADLLLDGQDLPAGRRTLGSGWVGGDLTSGLWDIAGDAGALVVGGLARAAGGQRCVVRATGSMARVSLGGACGLDLLAGVASGKQHADSRDDFLNPLAAVGGIVIRGVVRWSDRMFVDSTFSAPRFGGIRLLNMDATTGESGIYADGGVQSRPIRFVRCWDSATRAGWSWPASDPDGLVHIL